MGASKQGFRPPAERRVALGDARQRGAPWISWRRRWLSPRLLIPSRFGLPPVVNWRATMPSHAERSRPRSKLSDGGDKRADARIAPNVGIVVSRLASSLSFTERMNAASKAAIRRSSSAHCARASATKRTIRGLNPAPFCSSISTTRNVCQLPFALRRDQSSLQEDGAQLIDQRRPLPD
jgi:hypothetical protein